MLDNPLLVYDDISEAIKKSPMIKLDRIAKKHGIKCQVFGKCDFFLPAGSSKDRIAYSMVVEAEKRGDIKPGDTLVEGTSGNTGLGLALVSIIRGYKLIITIPDKMSMEKINTLRGLGAEVIVCPTAVPHSHPDSYTTVAKRIAKQPNHFYISQYFNLDNRLAHIQTTGPEIWDQMEGKIDWMFVGAGTCGTISGLGLYLHGRDPEIKVVGIDPIGSNLAMPAELNEKKKMYVVEGIGQSIIPGNMDYSQVKDWVKVEDKDTFVMARELISVEGMLVGGSSGSVVHGAFDYLKKNGLADNEDLRVMIFLPDTIRNYMTKLLDDAWMVGNQYYPVEHLHTEDHPLSKKTLKDVSGLVPMPYYDARLTVNDCFDLFKKNYSIIPIRAQGKITGVVTKESLMTNIVAKELHGMSSASHCTQLSYLSVPMDTPLDVVAKMLKSQPAIFAMNKDENDRIRSIFVITQNDILEYMHEAMKETI